MNKSRRLVVVSAALLLSAFLLSLISFGQGSQNQQNSSTNKSATPEKPESAPTNKSDSQSAPRSIMPPAAAPDFSQNTWNIPADADKTKNPVAATEESIAKGKELFMGPKGNCIFCHGESGAGNKENLPKLRRVPADLSDHERMPKLSDGEIFWKMTKGIPGIMPGREKQLTEEERWQVVNFVRTLAKEKPKKVG